MTDRPVDPPMVGTGPEITCHEWTGHRCDCSIHGCKSKARYAISITTVGILHACPGCRARVLAAARAAYGTAEERKKRVDLSKPAERTSPFTSFGGS